SVVTFFYSLSLHDALPILSSLCTMQSYIFNKNCLHFKMQSGEKLRRFDRTRLLRNSLRIPRSLARFSSSASLARRALSFSFLAEDRKSTRLNSSHVSISYA